MTVSILATHSDQLCCRAQAQQRLSVGSTPGLNGSFGNGFGQLPVSFGGPMGAGDALGYGGAAAASFRRHPVPGSRRCAGPATLRKASTSHLTLALPFATHVRVCSEVWQSPSRAL